MTVQWRKSSASTAVDDEACVEVAPVSRQEVAALTARFAGGGIGR
ncbi:hypothetical protein GCM10023191_076370 [Actinoallomurus oryzae]|jgi:hypothetical protein|uniref:DUF397 domain-containing protein n=1 Tax=Actinoallomurus oryzae TaxID=502180 RepID=A0ABP8QWC3_9ACTN